MVRNLWLVICKVSPLRLAYLHEALEPKGVHRDAKSSNILVDCQWNTKVFGFGFAKLLGSGKAISARILSVLQASVRRPKMSRIVHMVKADDIPLQGFTHIELWVFLPYLVNTLNYVSLIAFLSLKDEQEDNDTSVDSPWKTYASKYRKFDG
ncbi:hypothetical protein R1sor_011249 [Riccia sorocarpa]|uniref:Protein kinase domain-containing protein n=1 Tax=Riccia sorocarpa TaxID=122646 RepID=A0ABD3I0C8_9MARC